MCVLDYLLVADHYSIQQYGSENQAEAYLSSTADETMLVGGVGYAIIINNKFLEFSYYQLPQRAAEIKIRLY